MAASSSTPSKGPSCEEIRALKERHDFREFIRRASKHTYPSKKQAKDRVIQITNVRILRSHKLLDEDLWIRNGIVIDPMRRFWEARSTKEFRADEVIDGKGCIVAPGFLDLQLNGAFGVDFSSMSLEQSDVDHVSRSLLRHGCTAFMPTLVTSSPKLYKRNLPLFQPRAASLEYGAAILGAHCEGPFISEHKFGAHNKDFIQIPEKGYDSIEAIYGRANLPAASGSKRPSKRSKRKDDDTSSRKGGSIRMITMAPELKGAIDAGRALMERGVVVSAGHTTASIDVALDAFQNGGFRMMTHLFNAMPGFHHRDPGLVGLLGCKRLRKHYFYGLIADGVHSHPFSAAVAHASHPDGLVLVTDAMAAMGLPRGKHRLGEMDVEISGERVVVAGTNTLAGSVCSIDGCVRKLVDMIECDPITALEAASKHPAQAINMWPKKGSLLPGSDGDFVMLTSDLEVKATYIGGVCAWKTQGL